MEASKCPKCGDEPHFVEQVEKWYCYGCNSYIEDEEKHVVEDHAQDPALEVYASDIAEELKSLEEEDASTCGNCGAELEKIKDGQLFCFVCETYPEAPKPEVKEEPKQNEAQALLDSITVATPVEPKSEPAPVPTPVPEPKAEPAIEIKMCSACGQPLKWIEKYQRHYCYGCRKYAPREALETPAAPAKAEGSGQKHCPDCGKELKYIEKYSEFYCFTCKKYPLRAQKKTEKLTCPKCGGPLKLIEKYSRHYCFTCKEYAPNGHSRTSKKKTCPCCNEQMRFISEYNEWYCFKCKKYSLRPNKPVLLI